MSAPPHLLQHVQKLRTDPQNLMPKHEQSLSCQSLIWEEGSLSMADSLRAVSPKSITPTAH